MSKKDIDDDLIEEFEEAQKEYNEKVFDKTSDEEFDDVEEISLKENKEEKKVSKEVDENENEKEDKHYDNDNGTNNGNKLIYILSSLLGVLVIVIVVLLLIYNNKKEILISENDYNDTLEKIEKQKDKINKMTDTEKEIAGIKVDKEKEAEIAKEEEIKKENQTDTYKHYDELTDEEKEKQEVIPREQIIPIEEIDKIKDDEKIDDNKKLPEKFNLADKIKINVENQGGFGLCWDFASTMSLQTHYALKTGKQIDLSKIHVDYLMSNKIYGYRTLHEGGNFSDFEFYSTLTNPVETQLLEYKDYPDVKSIDYFLDIKTTDFKRNCGLKFVI